MNPLRPLAWCLLAHRIFALTTLVIGWMLFPSWAGAKAFDPRKALLNGDVLDYSNPTEWRVIQAEWIRAAVESHVNVDVRNAVIQGDLSLHYVQSEKEISLVDCQFTGALDASYAVFKQKLILDGSTFAKGADFTSAQF